MSHEHDRLSAYLDDELAPLERAEVAAHLQACAECAERLAALRAADEAFAASAAEAPPGYFESFPGRVRARLETKAARKRLPAWTWAVAAALVLAVVTPLSLRNRPSDLAPPSAAREARVEPAAAPAARPSAQPASPSVAQPARPAAPAPPARLLEHSERKQADARLGANAANELQRDLEADFARAPAEREAGADAPAAAALATAAPEPAPAEPAPAASRERAAARAEESAAHAAAPDERAKPDGLRDEAAPGASAGVAGGRAASMRSASATAKLASSEAEWRRLDAVRAGTLEEWRRLREDWRRYVARDPEGARADAARVRMLEAGRAAWRASADPADEAAFREDAAAYLDRDAATQKDRVRRMLSEPR